MVVIEAGKSKKITRDFSFSIVVVGCVRSKARHGCWNEILLITGVKGDNWIQSMKIIREQLGVRCWRDIVLAGFDNDYDDSTPGEKHKTVS